MLLTLVLLLAGVGIGLLRGGSLDNISGVRFRLPWLVFLGLAIQVGAEAGASRFPGIGRGVTGPILLAISYGFVAAFVAFNFRFPGALMIGLGLLLNMGVILANGAMPVSLWAVRVSGGPAAPHLQNAVKHKIKDRGTRLGFLGDVIPAGPLGIFSIGDVVLAGGVFVLVNHLVAPGSRRSRDAGEGGAGHPPRPSPPDPPPESDRDDS